ncbi:F-box domain contaning protein [Pseudohyphozyma bogoriensis]|nr:F-box domain contaning protein [Pseudohyphozyma bogoriensis]
MPFDVLYEIGQHLTPGDLLHLSLTCKVLRVVLLGTSAKSLWTNARKRLNFPDLSPLAPMTEQQYANLAWGQLCQVCGKKGGSPDFYYRRRLCARCSKNALSKTPDLPEEFHPSTPSCLVNSNGWHRKVDRNTASNISFRLHELQDEDDTERNLSRYKPSGTRSRRVQERPESDGESPPSRVDDFVAERRKWIKAINQDAESISGACQDYASKERSERYKESRARAAIERERRNDIEAKAQSLGYAGVFYDRLWYQSDVVNKAEPLSDAVWEEIKPKVLKLLDTIQAANDAKEAKNREASRMRERKRSLRSAYKDLFDSTSQRDAASTSTARIPHSFPLFPNFLNLPTVKKFWEPKDSQKYDEDKWNARLPEIEADVDEYRDALRWSAIATILSSTTDAEPDYADDAYPADIYDDNFLNRPSSYLFCTLRNCATRRRWYAWRRVSPRDVFYGPLPELLKHQHSDVHSSADMEDGVDGGRCDIPDLLARTLGSILVAAGLDDDASKEELDATGTYVWKNAPKKSVRKKKLGWKELMIEVHKVVVKYKRKKVEEPVIRSMKFGMLGKKEGDDVDEVEEEDDGEEDDGEEDDGEENDSGEEDASSGEEDEGEVPASDADDQ